MNKILLKLVLFILSLIKPYPIGCFDDELSIDEILDKAITGANQ